MSNGILYIVATPIGHLEDLTPRALAILKSVDLIAAEDTRHSGFLLNHFGIATDRISLHEHNEEQRSKHLINDLQQGKSIALISDAGTPLISDPGYRMVLLARQANIKVVPVPGACALITALCASGLPSDRFIFEGFLAAKSGQRQKQLANLKNETRTLIFYESPHRIVSCIEDMLEIFGAERIATVARELTKTFETIYSGTLAAIHNWINADTNQQKGEFVILVKGLDATVMTESEQSALHILKILLDELPVSQAAKLAAKITGAKKSWLYEEGLKIKN